MKVFPLPSPIPRGRETSITTRNRKLAQRWLCTNTNLTTVTLIFHYFPIHILTFPQFTTPGSPKTSSFLCLVTSPQFIALFRMIYKPQFLTTPLSYSSQNSPMCLHFACINKLWFFFSSVNLPFVSLIHRPQLQNLMGRGKVFLFHPYNSNDLTSKSWEEEGEMVKDKINILIFSYFIAGGSKDKT